MKAFVAKVSEILRLKKDGENYFEDSIKNYTIPKYQREFEWEKERINTFIGDINEKKKFLGIIMLEEKNETYEIIDGQQRMTIIVLALIHLYNINGKKEDVDESMEQSFLASHLFKNMEWILKNETIGSYAEKDKNYIHFRIDETNDIYQQKQAFNDAFETIKTKFRDDNITAQHFTSFLLDSTFLVLIKTNASYSESVEEMYLDINFKSKLLDEAAIFKGYCFKKVRTDFHDNLKNNWIKIKCYSKGFDRWGYKGLKEYLYHYFLSCPDTYSVPKSLSPNNTHILEGKTSNDIEEIINDLVSYGNDVYTFYENVCKETYMFNDIVEITDTQICKALRRMCKLIFEAKNQYVKLPFFMVIHYLKSERKLLDKIDCQDFIKFICNYYCYYFMFGYDTSTRKGKDDIDHSILDELYSCEHSSMNSVMKITKNLRTKYLNKYYVIDRYNDTYMYDMYTIIDFYIAKKNLISKVYSSNDGMSKEHLIIPQNKGKIIRWKHKNVNIDLSGLLDIKIYIKSIFNYIVIDKKLNECMKDDDIVEKVKKIKEYYKSNILKHISFFVDNIEKMNEYKKLENLKARGETDNEIIEQDYNEFVTEYFNENHMSEMKDNLKKIFLKTFTNY